MDIKNQLLESINWSGKYIINLKSSNSLDIKNLNLENTKWEKPHKNCTKIKNQLQWFDCSC